MRHFFLLSFIMFGFAFIAHMQYSVYNRTNLYKTVTPFNNFFAFSIMAGLMLLAALRADIVGNDTIPYIKIFDSVKNLGFSYINISRYEKGYLFLNLLVSLVTDNPQWIIIITSVFYYAIFTWFIFKHSNDKLFSAILFFLMLFTMSCSGIRQMIAMAITLLAFDKFIINKNFSAFLLIMVASIFHYSALSTLIFWVIKYFRYSDLSFIVIIMFVMTLITGWASKLMLVVLPQYAHYFNSKYFGTGRNAILINLIFSLLYYIIIRQTSGNNLLDINIMASKKLSQPRAYVNIIYNLISLPIYLYVFGFYINIIDRIIMYFSMYYIIIVPNAVKRIKNSKKQMAVKIIILALLFIWNVLIIYFRRDWNRVFPYLFFWQ